MQLLTLELFPELLEAVWNENDLAVRLHFSVDMLPDVVPGTKMFMRFGDNERPLVFNSWNTPRICQFDEDEAVPDVGADIISYIHGVMDFRSITGHYLPVFTDFPVTES